MGKGEEEEEREEKIEAETESGKNTMRLRTSAHMLSIHKHSTHYDIQYINMHTFESI